MLVCEERQVDSVFVSQGGQRAALKERHGPWSHHTLNFLGGQQLGLI